VLKRLVLFSGTFVFVMTTGFSQEDSAGVSPANAIAARQAALDMSSITFRSMGEAMKAGREAKSQGYPASALAKWAKALPGMFPRGTGEGESPAWTQARTAIWQDRAGFERAAANYAAQTTRLADLAKSNDTEAFTKQLEEVNQACNACHSRFKAGEQGRPKK